MADRIDTIDLPDAYPAERARQGDIVLRTRLRRTVFLAGLIGLLAVAALFAIFAWQARETAQTALDREMPALAKRDVASD